MGHTLTSSNSWVISQTINSSASGNKSAFRLWKKSCEGGRFQRGAIKDGMESTAARRALEVADDFANRKLIRPSLRRPEDNNFAERRARDRPIVAKKTPPPEQTHAENFYYQKQIQAKTRMVIVLRD